MDTVSRDEQLPMDVAWGESANHDQSDSTNPSSEVEGGGFTEVRRRRSRKRTRVASPPGQSNVRPTQQPGFVRGTDVNYRFSDGNSNSYGGNGGRGSHRDPVLGHVQGQRLQHTPVPSNLTGYGGTSRGTTSLRGRGRSLLTGRGMASHNIAAVRPVRVQKKVYCIDNLSVSVTCDMMWDFLRNDLQVDVQSLYPAQTRRRRNDVNFKDRTAFRVCINAHDVPLLLQDYQWPAGVVISEWYRIPPEDRNNRQSLSQHAEFDRPVGGQRTATVDIPVQAPGSLSAPDSVASNFSSVGASGSDMPSTTDHAVAALSLSTSVNLGPTGNQLAGVNIGDNKEYTGARCSSSSDSSGNDSTASTVTALETSTWSGGPGTLTSAGDDVTAVSVSSSPIVGGSVGVAPPGSDDSVAVMDISDIVVADGVAEPLRVSTDLNDTLRLAHSDTNRL
jgi:hypothetical protein